MNIDPLAENYIFQSSFAFAGNNPVYYVDINGEGYDTDFKLDKDGSITRVDENDGSEDNNNDRLFSTDDGGNVNTDDYVQVDKNSASDDTIISDLSETDDNNVSSSVNNTNPNDVFKTFLFAAHNSNVEWEAGKTWDNKCFIGTAHNPDKTFSFESIGLSKKNVSAYVHSHVGIDYSSNSDFVSEKKSMGYFWRRFTDSDWGQVSSEVQDNNMKYLNYRYIYVPKSGRLWRAGYTKPHYIRNIKGNSKRFFFGTLNSK